MVVRFSRQLKHKHFEYVVYQTSECSFHQPKVKGSHDTTTAAVQEGDSASPNRNVHMLKSGEDPQLATQRKLRCSSGVETPPPPMVSVLIHGETECKIHQRSCGGIQMKTGEEHSRVTARHESEMEIRRCAGLALEKKPK